MLIAAWAVELIFAVYMRDEYQVVLSLADEIERLKELDSSSRDMSNRRGAGAYICGERRHD